MPELACERFSLFAGLDDPADGFEAECGDTTLITAPDDDILYRLEAGLLDAGGAEVLITPLQGAKILARRLVARAGEQRVFVRGLDAMHTAFETQRRIRYIPHPPPEVLEESDASSVEDKVGTWTARGIAADLLLGTGLTLFWGVRDYTFAEVFDGSGTVYELLRRLVAPWDQPAPFGVDIWCVGTELYITPRVPSVTATDTMTVAQSRLSEITLGDRRQLPVYGLVTLEGRMEPGGGVTFHPGDPPVVEGSLVTIPFSVPVTDPISGAMLSLYEGTRTYRMPDRLLVASVERQHQRNKATGILLLMSEEATETAYEVSLYGPTGPLNQPLPQSESRRLVARVQAPTTSDPNATALRETQREQTAWTYDARRFLVAKVTSKQSRTETTVGSTTTVTFPETDRVTETYKDRLDGWVEITTTRVSIGSDGTPAGSSTLSHQDAAGFRPGGVRHPFEHAPIIDVDTGTLTPVTREEELSDADDAIPVRYSNRNLTGEDLEHLLGLYEAASGLYEYPLLGSGPAMPFLVKGAVLSLTGFTAPDGSTPIDLDPAQVRRITLRYENTERRQEFVGELEAVFYRAS